MVCLRRALLSVGAERLLQSPHGAEGVDGVNGLAAQITGQRFRLAFAVRRQVHVNPAAKLFLVARFHFAMADEQQARGGGRRRCDATGFL